MDERPLRVLGTSATLTPGLCRAAKEQLPFAVEFDILDGLPCQRRGIMSPGSYDVYDQWFHSLDLLWTAVAIQAIDTARIRRWGEIRIAGSGQGTGARPGDLLYVQHDRSLGPLPAPGAAARIAMLPTTYNLDSFAWGPEVEALRHAGEAESWAWLLDERWHGRCAMAQDPAASAVELALAARAAGLMEIGDPGDLSVEEIDELFSHLMRLKRSGHFGRFWASAEDSVKMMAGPGTAMGAIWSPAWYRLRAAGQKLSYAAPKEGYRGWHSGLSISAATEGARLDMAYSYLNWWLDGTPGAIMARQGYYMSVPEPLKQTLTPAEWDYWYAGLPAAEDLPGLDLPVVVRKGERREGGSWREREARVTVWSTIMPEHNYLIRRWREFIDG
ncbi:ABC transporter substrate-binding protein [Pseudogemmobacter faecipullorum]|uniref:Extracellular solute-binding protein n=1 Tax=Pseudogemmobacter faecipullorum TaxID=2755041 RepID=A0ABS8CKS6_9RHOB|nr:extracellular solute-binding protein [Pseudogemmobacter faecipullorum]MCB5409460.1 extracellular solute-binding protein [Pseudogemmobacter faecipullorum]